MAVSALTKIGFYKGVLMAVRMVRKNGLTMAAVLEKDAIEELEKLNRRAAREDRRELDTQK